MNKEILFEEEVKNNFKEILEGFYKYSADNYFIFFKDKTRENIFKMIQFLNEYNVKNETEFHFFIYNKEFMGRMRLEREIIL